MIAGILGGLVLLRYEAILGFPAEGIIGGLLFGLFIRDHVRITKTIVASLFAILIGLFGGAFIGLLIYDGYYVPSIISGLLVGGIFGLIIGAGKRAYPFALIGAVVFLLGDLVTSMFNVWGGDIYNLTTDMIGENGYQIAVVAINSLFHGIALGLGTGLYIKKDRITWH
jgi:hypothetical protein